MRMSFFFYNSGVVRWISVAFCYRIFEICIFVRNIYILTRYFYNDIFITGLDVKYMSLMEKYVFLKKEKVFDSSDDKKIAGLAVQDFS